MFLFELFNDEGGMINLLRSQVVDFLTPLAAEKAEYVTMQEIADFLRDAKTGLMIDRGMIMNLIDPKECKMVKEIQGDKVYLALPLDDMSAKTEDNEERDREKVANTASTAAKKAVQDQ